MWDRKAVKEKAKGRISVNYWKMVLVALLLTLISGGSGILNVTYNDEERTIDYGAIPFFNESVDVALFFGVGAVLILVIVVVAIAGIMLSIFVCNPLIVGSQKFFLNNIHEAAELKEIGSGFEKDYLNKVKIMFMRNLFTFLWSLLLIVPGIIKSYEYRMVPYILAENGSVSQSEAFERSKKMMTGNKWKAFVFDLSYIGWQILSAITFGIVGIFYVNPYYHQGCAMLYDAIKYDCDVNAE